MKTVRLLSILLVLIPVLGFGQLKKDVQNPNISNTLITNYNNRLLGFLDPSRLTMHHSLSMAYTSFGGTDLIVNTYLNTMQYQFSENFLLTTKLGIMTSPYNSFPGDNALTESQLFGGAEIRYMPSKNTIISLSFESTPYYYQRNSFYHMSNRYGLFGE
jgi:hypothetical protein